MKLEVVLLLSALQRQAECRMGSYYSFPSFLRNDREAFINSLPHTLLTFCSLWQRRIAENKSAWVISKRFYCFVLIIVLFNMCCALLERNRDCQDNLLENVYCSRFTFCVRGVYLSAKCRLKVRKNTLDRWQSSLLFCVCTRRNRWKTQNAIRHPNEGQKNLIITFSEYLKFYSFLNLRIQLHSFLTLYEL